MNKDCSTIPVPFQNTPKMPGISVALWTKHLEHRRRSHRPPSYPSLFKNMHRSSTPFLSWTQDRKHSMSFSSCHTRDTLSVNNPAFLLPLWKKKKKRPRPTTAIYTFPFHRQNFLNTDWTQIGSLYQHPEHRACHYPNTFNTRRLIIPTSWAQTRSLFQHLNTDWVTIPTP